MNAPILQWQRQAACGGYDNPEAFFPREGASALEAKTICIGCPVASQCLEYAMAYHDDGIWGGLTESERKDLRRSGRPLPVAPSALCKNNHNLIAVGITRNGQCAQCKREHDRIYNQRFRNGHTRAATLEHGTRSRYMTGCRCDRCKQAHRQYQIDRRLRVAK